MKLKQIFTIFSACFVLFPIAGCYNDKAHTKVHACFTPGENCTENIVNIIQQAKTSILIQAHAFSSDAIVKALVAAKQRHVNVEVLFDQSLWTHKNSSISVLMKNEISVSLDKKVTVAHNNVIIVDHHKVITGSFDFTQEAQEKNADNLVIIENTDIAKRYADNWHSRSVLSEAAIEPPKIEKKKPEFAQGKSRKNNTKKKRKTASFWPFKS